MAGYGINQQGVENLQKLASDLHHFNDNFEEAALFLFVCYFFYVTLSYIANFFMAFIAN